MKQSLKSAGLALLLAITANHAVAQEKIKIGVIVTLSGPAAERISWLNHPCPGFAFSTLSRTIFSGHGSARLAAPSTTTAAIPIVKPLT